jgi:hypothetical protein
MRFSLPKLFMVVTLAALACAGMTLRTRWWADSIVSLTALLFVAVAIAAFQSSDQSRAFRFAFATVGILYLLVTINGTFLLSFRDSLLTSRTLVLAAQALDIPVTPTLLPRPIGGIGRPPSFNQLETFLNKGSSTNEGEIPAVAFYVIGQCAWSWVLALLAGWFSGWLYAKREMPAKA